MNPDDQAADQSGYAEHRSMAEQGGYTEALNAILFSTQLSPEARLLYFMLKHFGWKHGKAIPSQSTLARYLSRDDRKPLTERTIRSYLEELYSAGLVTCERRGLTQSNRYWIEPVEAFVEAQIQSERKSTPPLTYEQKRRSAQKQIPTSAHEQKPATPPEQIPESTEEDSRKKTKLRSTLRATPEMEQTPLLTTEIAGSYTPITEADIPTNDGVPYSPYIAGVIMDLSHELNLGDGPRHVTRAMRLWQQSGQSEEDFVSAMQEARKRLRKHQSHIANRGAWYFTALVDLVIDPEPARDGDQVQEPGVSSENETSHKVTQKGRKKA